MSASKIPSVKLSSGFDMPLIGLGVLMVQQNETQKAVETAIDAGYRHIDTAMLYQNEAEVGLAIRNKIADGSVKREDLFVITKLLPIFMKPELVSQGFQKSFDALDIGYIDLYLVHTPLGYVHNGDDRNGFPADEQGKPKLFDVDHAGVWKELEKLVKAGKVKSIGLSNYNRRQIQNVLDNSEIKPANLQIEVQLYLQQKPLIEFCHENGISVTAYGPLGSPGFIVPYNQSLGRESPRILDAPELEPLKAKYHKSGAQILLRWLTQRNIIVIPKSTNAERIKENISIFDFSLTPEELNVLGSLDRNVRLFHLPPGTEKSVDHPYANDAY